MKGPEPFVFRAGADLVAFQIVRVGHSQYRGGFRYRDGAAARAECAEYNAKAVREGTPATWVVVEFRARIPDALGEVRA